MQESRDLLLWICVALVLSIGAAMVWSIVVHRRSMPGGVRPFHHSIYAELAWACAPLLIVTALLAEVLAGALASG